MMRATRQLGVAAVRTQQSVPEMTPAVAAQIKRATYSPEQVERTVKRHLVPQWASFSMRDATVVHVDHGKGCYLYGADGKQYTDWSSQAMCTNLGHGVPEIAEAVAAQINKVAMLESRYFYADVQAELCENLARRLPDQPRYFFTESGATAVESAVRMARTVTGRQKVFSRYRAYHGGTESAMSLTGGWDPRRELMHSVDPNVRHFVDATAYGSCWGGDDAKALEYLQEMVNMERPGSIAAIIIEAIGGATGVVHPSKEYLQGMQKICRDNGIIFIVDEVMMGFCRTGKWFGFEHFGLEPDMVIMAKGLSAAAMPLGCVAMTDAIAAYFETNPVPCGSTYNAHPSTMAAANAAFKIYEERGLDKHAASMEPVMRARMDQLIETSKAGGLKMVAGRVIGMMGFAEFDGRVEQALPLRNALLDKGIAALTRYNRLSDRLDMFCTPPLVTSEAQIHAAWDAIGEAIRTV